ncbi:MAG: bifunctional diaminohydroxyphosphoribosylaminopyrimidine deaminase/5-amino-6-(5-phosphoribosylamino)uracil reductase RibD [Candidatus Aminicenantes bacterium]|nr:bifunctional diaminohydroxyphosphoribosylaminopyrimidine deaminase/5-amino-6-(5-phosphoribosylamino)uracil reductase RibD [Candidatus Aminicenantes bacterium]
MIKTQEIIDRGYMQMAYSLAARARGWASPNPYVGAVVVKGNKIIGYGYHEQPGKPHAEVVALEMAGEKSRDSTLYVTLEPCVHWGRTPPCVETVLRFRPKRVVISSLDPNPIVYKKGVERLREKGIEVDLGCLKEINEKLNEAYFKFVRHGRPWVILKAALSLDAKIAAVDGSSKWLTGPLARDYVHLLRGEVDALLVGINTILKDNPRLTVRHPLWPKKHLTRVILDSQLRLPLNSRLLNTLDQGPIIVFSSNQASSRKQKLLEKKGVKIIKVSHDGRWLNLEQVLEELGQLGIASILVEGGGQVLTSFFEQNLADKIYLHIAPCFLGGERATSLFKGHGFPSIENRLKLRHYRTFWLGPDIILEGYF